MAKTTGIEWCDSTVNSVPGCTGCELYHSVPARNHCYAADLCRRYAGRKGWPKSFTEPRFFPGRIEKAIVWTDLTGTDRPDKPWLNKYPRVIFLNDLGDTFAPTAPDPENWLVPLMAEMAKSPHLWLFLTKWPRRMCEFFTEHKPPESFWPGTSIINQKWADKNVRWLLQTPAAVRFVSAEPLLGAVDLSSPLNGMPEPYGGGHRGYVTHEMAIDVGKPEMEGMDLGREEPEWQQTAPALDWVIVGGESGPGARPMHPDWARSLRDQCQQAGVPFFFKQWGAWVPFDQWRGGTGGWGKAIWFDQEAKGPPDMVKVSKYTAGRILDGRTWSEMPGQETEP